MARAQMVGFRAPKAGNSLWDWEDFYAYADGPDSARCVVLDGATEAFDAQRWARQLGEAFVTTHPSVLDPPNADVFLAWIEQMQQRWDAETATAALSVIEEIKLRETGSMATFLGCELAGLAGPRPVWHAVALGDVVLFHVREGRLLETFPDLTSAGFGINPVGVFTLPRMNARMHDAFRHVADRPLRVGDILFVASDAFAEWLVGIRPGEPWAFLTDLDDPRVFAHFVSGLRAADLLKNDDVTLLRVEITAGDPEYFAVGW